MIKSKDERVKMLDDCKYSLIQLSKAYKEASPAWTLIVAAWGHINSIHHLETETSISNKNLGARAEEESDE